jgi:acetoin utilization deacetylase AcuC-like enzyme
MKIISQPLGLALDRIRSFGADTLVVALGLDAHEADPFHGFKVTTAGFARIAGAIAGMDLPVVIVQEGGYLSSDLGDNLTSFLNGYEAG